MEVQHDTRPDPEALLQSLKQEEEKKKKGKLKIFLGMSAGVGKTYDMLLAAHEAKSKGIDVVVGYVEAHGRPETEALLEGLEILPRQRVEYRGSEFEEMDLDAVLRRQPQLALVDELAHTNIPGSRHTKRYQDVMELLNNDIDVYTTLNVQHLESRADTVAQITGTTIRETVPDSIFAAADEVELIDLPPEELLKRLAEGKVYAPERSQRAIQNFFRLENLTALREMALRITTERVDRQLRSYMRTRRILGPWKSGQRLIMGISPSPYSIRLIRWARRMAYTMDATWIAVYVETSKPLSDAAKEQLRQNIKLARELGAEIITTSDEDIVAGILRVARQENATQILMGKSGAWQIFRRKSLLERLIERSGNLDVYVVGGEEEKAESRKRHFIFSEIRAGISQYGIAAAIVILVALICYPVTDLIGYQTVSLIMLLTVSILPLKLSAGPVLLAAALSALIWDFFFIPPKFTFAVQRLEDMLMLGTYFIIAIVSGVLSARSRAQEKAVRQREERATALYTLTKNLSLADTQNEVIQAAVDNIKKFFNAEVIVYIGESDGDLLDKPHPASSMSVDAKEFSVAAWCYWNEKKAGRFTDTLPFAMATYYPLSGPRYVLGVIGVKLVDDKPLTLDQETLLENFTNQISSSIEREFLNEMNKKSLLVAESERLYKTLFNSISHELRTPLSTIMAASEALMDEATSRRSEAKTELAQENYLAAKRLNRVVVNLMDMTRLESGLNQPKLDWCDVRDLINASVKELEKELAGRPLSIEVPPDMPLVKIDFGLMERALTNLLHNACEYTPAGCAIQIRAYVEDKSWVITISDNGPGLPAEDLKKVFEKFYRRNGSKAGGIGLGLSIVKGFVEAHQGTIAAENREEGGARFLVRLPVSPIAS